MTQFSRSRLNRYFQLALTGTAIACGVIASTARAADLTKVVVSTNWFAQAEHGGLYQAKATGIYEKHGLDVTIRMGGPQVNNMQIMLAGQNDFVMGYGIRTLNAVSEGLPVITVAAGFQKDPSIIVTHQHVKSIEDIKNRSILISTSTRTTFWPWMKAKYGFSESQVKPYTFSMAPFLADKELTQQGYISSEPFAIEKGGVKPNVFLLADYGYPDYAATIDTTHDMVKKNPDLVRRFVQATMEGWKSYLSGDPAPANALIKKDNPQMTDEQIAYGISKMKQYGIVGGGDAATKGMGYMSDARWQEIFGFLSKAGVLPKNLDVKKVYTTEFLPKKPVLMSE
ncbi:MAG: NitT/TauT family transport system substrate-binding protein [Burkholderiales bacterium]|jgi:NitT/TauT family transport system substrate-binding protein